MLVKTHGEVRFCFRDPAYTCAFAERFERCKLVDGVRGTDEVDYFRGVS